MNYSLAIFDFDGTLADTLPWMRSIFNELAEEHGFRRLEPHEHERFRELHGSALLRELDLPLWKFGDEIRDAEAAAKAGIAFGAVIWSQHKQEILCKQRRAEIFETVHEILASVADPTPSASPRPNSRIHLDLIGCGHMGRVNLSNFAVHPNVVVTAACDVDENRPEPTVEQFKGT